MHGAGNDFILLDGRSGGPGPGREQIRRLCARRVGIGADGLMRLLPSARADFALEYYNADGSPAEMCANGARCAVALAHALGMAPASCSFEIGGQTYRGEVMGEDRVKLWMPSPTIVATGEGLPRPELPGAVPLAWIIAGVPHVVVAVDEEPDAGAVERWGRYLRRHPQFQPQGANANFVRRMEQGYLRARVYERGVEAETLACGTGAVACARAAALVWEWESPVRVEMPGGVLEVAFDREWREVALIGPVARVYVGEASLPVP